jgi:hypothetical protein
MPLEFPKHSAKHTQTHECSHWAHAQLFRQDARCAKDRVTHDQWSVGYEKRQDIHTFHQVWNTRN